jgi:hypothetical protein
VKRARWGRHVEFFWKMESLAVGSAEKWKATRCQKLDSGGVQCTADAKPKNHKHRYDKRDLPGGDAYE